MNQKEIGKNIAVLRNARGWTQTELAKRMGCFASSVSEHEKSGKMSFETMCRYAETLGCAVADLLNGVTNPEDFHLDADLFAYWPWNLALAVWYGERPPQEPQTEAQLERLEDAKERVYKVYIPKLLKSLGDLTDREQNVLYMRFNNNMTLEQVGKQFGVTRDRIRQIEAKALRKLRHPRHAKHWLMDTMDKAEEAMKERDRLKLENMELNHKLANVYASLGLKEKAEEAAGKVDPEIVKDLKVDELELSVRSYNCLKRAGYNRLSDFNGKTMDNFMKIRNLGRKSLEEILTRLRANGYDFNEKGFMERTVLFP